MQSRFSPRTLRAALSLCASMSRAELHDLSASWRLRKTSSLSLTKAASSFKSSHLKPRFENWPVYCRKQEAVGNSCFATWHSFAVIAMLRWLAAEWPPPKSSPGPSAGLLSGSGSWKAGNRVEFCGVRPLKRDYCLMPAFSLSCVGGCELRWVPCRRAHLSSGNRDDDDESQFYHETKKGPRRMWELSSGSKGQWQA